MAYGICKVCGCTENNPCFNPVHGYCWWADDTHELCSHCADPDIANDPETRHCVNSNQSLAEVLVCKNCRYWHKADADIEDDAAFGTCDINEEWGPGCPGSDPICADFEEKEG